MSRIRLFATLVLSVLLVVSELGVFSAVPAAAQETPTVKRDGLTEATAAASCWEIKQKDPNSADGVYWLLTPQMAAPAQFFCDQTMDGGGWVMIGRGREGWDRYPDGKGKPEDLHKRERTPASFPAALLPSATIDGLLGGVSVNALAEGMRVVRATDAQGTSWQTFDMRPKKMQSWTWALSSEDTATYRINNGAWQQSGLMNAVFGTDTGWNRMDLTTGSARKYNMGFGYGSSVRAGDTSATNFLWSANGSAPLPYAELYIRPQVSSDNGFEALPDEGAGPITGRALVANFAQKTSWGVTGNLNGRTNEGNSPVQAFAEIGDTIYIGGNFTNAEEKSTGKVVPRTALAAFDRATGALRESFQVQLDNQVKALLALPDGRLLVGGEFKNVNGQPHSGTVVLDPATGAIDPAWNLEITTRLTNGVLRVSSLALGGDYIYIGGSFTHLSSNGMNPVYARGAARVKLDGVPDRSWNPEFNGSVVDIDTSPNGDRFYAAGYFTKSAGNTAVKAAVLSTEPGAAPAVSNWVFQGSSSERGNYQQAIDDTGSLVFIGGSEHSLFGYDPGTLERVSGSITKSIGGDMQAIASNGDITYAGCHCSQNSYENAYTWSVMNADWTKVDSVQWVAAWDARTGKQLGQFAPYMLRSNNAGAWSLFLDSDGALWAGGDFTGSRTSLTASQWNGGWVKYPARDVVAPETPGKVWAGTSTDKTVDLQWDKAADATSYEILRDDRVVATATTENATVPRGGNNRFFIRSVDGAGNRSATTPLFLAPEAGGVDPNSPVLIDQGATWHYSYNQGAPDDTWTKTEFDRSGWDTGTVPIGYGDANVSTKITPPAGNSRPITTYFAKTFQVADPAAFSTATLEYVADDGAVVYLNGTEISRARMPEGAVSADTRANTAVSTSTANGRKVKVEIPSSMLVAGDNTIAVETHLNYRSSPSMTFDGNLKITNSDPSPNNPSTTFDRTVLAAGSPWLYWYDPEEPDADWATTADVILWQEGTAPIGWGDADVATQITTPATGRARTAYFVKDLDLDLSQVPDNTKLILEVRADDGALVRVNGTEVGRKRLPEGEIAHDTYASQAVGTKNAKTDLITVEIPVSELNNGSNRIAVETHINYRSTPSMTFEATARLVAS